MSVRITYFVLLLALSGLVLIWRFPPRWQSWRKKIFVVVFGAWLVIAGWLAATFLRDRSFFGAVEADNVKLVSALLSKRPELIRARTISIWENDTALHLAARKGNTAMVVALLKAGADGQSAKAIFVC